MRPDCNSDSQGCPAQRRGESPNPFRAPIHGSRGKCHDQLARADKTPDSQRRKSNVNADKRGAARTSPSAESVAARICSRTSSNALRLVEVSGFCNDALEGESWRCSRLIPECCACVRYVSTGSCQSVRHIIKKEIKRHSDKNDRRQPSPATLTLHTGEFLLQSSAPSPRDTFPIRTLHQGPGSATTCVETRVKTPVPKNKQRRSDVISQTVAAAEF